MAAEGGTVESSKVPTLADQHRSIRNLLLRPSPFGNETGTLPNGEFLPGVEVLERLRTETRVLVIGSGGLGCELLKDLALSGFCDIHVIDLDTIDLTNLNRQFLFRMKDIGAPKAEVASRFVSTRVPGVNLTWYRTPIQRFPVSFFEQFQVIIGGLDNLEARRWMNATLCSLVQTDEDGDITNPEAIIPFIDGGTEGFKGQARVVLPKITACFECTLDMFPPQVVFPECTIASTPRQPEHCIVFAKEKLWPEAFPGREMDTDNPEDMKWIFTKAAERAESFGIRGVTLAKTQGVVKNIIPAIASTNALVSAVCALEAFKITTFSSQTVNNYLMALGQDGLHASTFALERKEEGECLACRSRAKHMDINPLTTLNQLRQLLCRDPELQLKDPGLGMPGKSLYFPHPPALARSLAPNLQKPIKDLIESGETTLVTDRMFPRDVSLNLTINLDEAVPIPDDELED